MTTETQQVFVVCMNRESVGAGGYPVCAGQTFEGAALIKRDLEDFCKEMMDRIGSDTNLGKSPDRNEFERLSQERQAMFDRYKQPHGVNLSIHDMEYEFDIVAIPLVTNPEHMHFETPPGTR